jgi:N-acetyl-gamma-glutamyl-phosphate reductase
MHKVFIDGHAGTTGLEIGARLCQRRDLEILQIADADRKNADARRHCLNAADVVILCLPDAAAREAVALLENPSTKVLDASTAHRTADDWAYGLPELTTAQRACIQQSKRVSNPGCYPTGFLLAMRTLVDAGFVPRELHVTVTAISGYSGGGRGMIESYQRGDSVQPPKAYGLDLSHKHVPEMRAHAGLVNTPLFVPMVAHYYRGMLVQIPLANAQLNGVSHADDIQQALQARFADEPFVDVLPMQAEAALDGGYLSPLATNNSNRVELLVFGNSEWTLVVARLDNLGKGAAGAAVQNLNLMLGAAESEGLS